LNRLFAHQTLVVLYAYQFGRLRDRGRDEHLVTADQLGAEKGLADEVEVVVGQGHAIERQRKGRIDVLEIFGHLGTSPIFAQLRYGRPAANRAVRFPG
jgi:hypothetical protein